MVEERKNYPEIPGDVRAELKRDMHIYGGAFVEFKDSKWIRLHPPSVGLSKDEHKKAINSAKLKKYAAYEEMGRQCEF